MTTQLKIVAFPIYSLLRPLPVLPQSSLTFNILYILLTHLSVWSASPH